MQLNFFEQVLENKMASSEERLVQLGKVGCRATRRMPTVTGSTVAVAGWTAEQRSSFRSTAKRDGEVLVEAFNARRSMKVMGVNLRVQYENSMRCDKPSVMQLCQQHRSTSMLSFRKSVASVQAGEIQTHRRAIDPVKSCGLQ